MSKKIRTTVTAVAAVLLALALVPASPASAAITCVAPSTTMDQIVAAGGTYGGKTISAVRFRLPNGGTASVGGSTPTHLASYAAARGTLTQVCYYLV